MTSKVVIFGAAGQDGSYLVERLLSDGYEIHAVVRRNSVAENQDYRLSDVASKISTYYGDVTDFPRVFELISEIRPDYIYNLAAQSHVRVSFDIPSFTLNVNANGVLNILNAIKNIDRKITFYQASSSEMYGDSVDSDGMQRESTHMRPVSPYGCSKLLAYNLTNVFRESYGLNCFNGILFNHESPRRGSNFVSSKIVKGAVLISKGKLDKIYLGNLEAQRDWGHSRDYVRAMQLMMESGSPDNYVVSTGTTRSVRQMCEVVFGYLDLDWREYVQIDERFMRPNELPYLCGDSTKIRKQLGWKPEISFEELIREMADFWLTQTD